MTKRPPKKPAKAKPKLGNISLALIDEQDRARKDYGELDDLSDTIKEHGVLQSLLLQPTEGGRYRVLAGGRRFRAASMAGLTEVPAIIREVGDPIEEKEIELLENIERKDFSWSERCLIVRDIDLLYRTKFNRDWTERKTASILGRSHGGVNRQIQLAAGLDAIPELKECRTEDEAFRKLKKLEEEIILRQLKKQQDGAIQTEIEAVESGEQQEVSPRIKAITAAEHHYIIGDVFLELEELKEIQEEQGGSSIRFIECDPPFGIDLLKNKQRIDNDKDLSEYHEVAREDYQEWLLKLCPLLYSIAATDAWMVFWFGTEWDREVRNSLVLSGWHVDVIPAVWVKGEEESSGSGQTASPHRYLARASEFFYVCRKGNPVLAAEGSTNVFPHKPVPAKRKYHPTQKPLSLYQDILSTFCFPGTIMCVPFLGSGQTLKAAYSVGMTGFGWDIANRYRDPFLLSIGDEEG